MGAVIRLKTGTTYKYNSGFNYSHESRSTCISHSHLSPQRHIGEAMLLLPCTTYAPSPTVDAECICGAHMINHIGNCKQESETLKTRSGYLHFLCFASLSQGVCHPEPDKWTRQKFTLKPSVFNIGVLFQRNVTLQFGSHNESGKGWNKNTNCYKRKALVSSHRIPCLKLGILSTHPVPLNKDCNQCFYIQYIRAYHLLFP